MSVMKYRFRSVGVIALTVLISGVVVFSGCRSGLFSSTGGKQKRIEEPKTPAAPVVVDGVRTSYADIVQKTAPAVVQITAIRKEGSSSASTSPFEDLLEGPRLRRQPRPRPRTRGLGSGVIVSADGTILTNHHVVEDAEKITVEMKDNRTFIAKVVGSDAPSDLAVLKITAKDLPFLKLGDSNKVRVGDIVLAIGNPLGIGQTVTSGIISAKSRQTPLGEGTAFQDFLQTDAAINQGNSGGALVNVNGELIGINSQILSRTGGSIGIGFAIPSNMADSVMTQLLENGRVRRGMLGVNIQDITSDLAQGLGLKKNSGVIVSNVMKGSAAEKAGIVRGDIITKINEEAVRDGNFLRNKVAETLPGTEVKLNVIRDSKAREIRVKLGELKSDGKDSGTEENEGGSEGAGRGRLGLSLKPLAPASYERYGIPEDVEGLLVTEVDPDSDAAEKGIRTGDVVMEINRESVTALGDVRSAIRKSGGKPVLLLMSRRGQTFFTSVRLNK